MTDIAAIIQRIAAGWGVEFSRPGFLRLLWLAPLVWAAGAVAARRGAAVSVAAAAALRTAVLLLAVLLLAGAGVTVEETRPGAVIAALDVSDSMGEEGKAWARERAAEILEGAGPDAQKGVIFFARGSRMNRPLSRDLPGDRFDGGLATDATDISSAIDGAALALPSAGPRRLVVLSDGNENLGDARAAAARAAARGIRIDCLSPPAAEGGGASLRRLDLPDEIRVGEPFTARIIAFNAGARPVPSTLAVRDGGALVREWPVTLQPGTNAFELPYAVASPGVRRITASVSPVAADGGTSLAAPLLAVDRPRILCLAGTGEGRNFLAEVLSTREIEVRVGGVELFPASFDDLLAYDCVVLSNVPRAALGTDRMEMLRRYVRDEGGGLVMLGGADSFGPGGYRRTPVEEVLPVSMEGAVPFEREKAARLCIILVIDKSGSMGFGFGEKMIAARRAAEELVKQLSPDDMVGIIPFDSFHTVLVPLEAVGARKAAVIDRIRMIEPGGGTRIAGALEAALSQLAAARGRARHVILMTDGQTHDIREYDYRGLVAAYSRSEVSISTIGIGRDADRDFLRALALGTGGEYYYVRESSTLPMIVLEDTRRVLEKSGLVEEAIRPKMGPGSEMLAGISGEQIPTLLGYVITAPKRGAEVALYTDVRGLRDPILAGWRHGLGRAVAFTSDVEARWSREMVGWGMFAKFWAQVVRWAMRERSPDLYLVRAGPAAAGRERLELETFGPVGEEVSFRLSVPSHAPGKRRVVSLRQTAPHAYGGETAALPADADMVVVERVEEGKVTVRKEAAVLRRAPAPDRGPESMVAGPDEGLLGALAAAAGGLLNPPADALSFPPEVVPARRSAPGRLIALLLLALLGDIAVRKFRT
ncbi:MAG: VWA domain-containing protein [bacterium]|nr:VWA domain-containing protein [bacterium]